MTEFTCPECGQKLVKGVDDFRAHALHHWGVDERRIERIPNRTAQARYMAIIDADKDNSAEEDDDIATTARITVKDGVL
jgi:hypothetical protein